MNAFSFTRACLLSAVLAAVLFSFSGCATNDSENLSSRPWNTPKGWEHGFPTMLNEGR